MTTDHLFGDVRLACQQFPARFQTLQLGTVAADGQPEASYAPYVVDRGRYYVYLSRLARHASNLRETPRASVLFIEGEAEAKHLFSRERLTLACAVTEITRATPRFDAVLDMFDQRFGKFMQVIRPLQDFGLFELKPVSGSYVAGFARAYVLDGEDLGHIRHRNDEGHQSPNREAEQQNIRAAFAQARSKGLRAKEAAEAIGLTEGVALAAHAFHGQPELPGLAVDTPLTTWAFKPDWLALLKSLEACGPVMALTRNETTVHEKTGVYTNLSGNDHIGLVVGPDIDLRLFLQRWAGGFLVVEPGNATDGHAKTSLQFFDARGVAVHKVFPVSGTQRAIWNTVVESWVEPQRVVTFDPALPADPKRSGDGLDAAALAADWAAMTDTHQFFGLLKKHDVERQHAFQTVRGRFTRQVPVSAVRQALYKAAFDGLPIMVFVGNPGCIQIHSGTVVRVEPMDMHGKTWLNVLDPGFNLHLREDLIAHCWVAEKPTEDGIVSSLEVFDAAGDVMAMLFGVRKPGQPELQGWRDLLAELTTLPEFDLEPQPA